MSKFRIKFSQSLIGHYNGVLELEGDSKKEILSTIKGIPNNDLDDIIDWTQGDEYYGDTDTIKVESIEEVEDE